MLLKKYYDLRANRYVVNKAMKGHNLKIRPQSTGRNRNGLDLAVSVSASLRERSLSFSGSYTSGGPSRIQLRIRRVHRKLRPQI